MKIGKQAEDSPTSRPKNTAPPDYTSRKVQYRLLVIVALVMAMLLSFQWIWSLVSPPVANNLEVMRGAEPISFGRVEIEPGDIRGDALARARSDLWNKILDEIDAEEEISMLHVLHSIRHSVPVTDLEKQNWWELYQKLDGSWESYHDDAFLAIRQNKGGYNDQQLAVWLDVLEQVESEWKGKLREALLAVTEKKPISSQQRQTLVSMQQSLDQAALSRVEDHTVFRPRDNAAWFRILELLQELDDQQLSRGSHGQVGGLQLAEQMSFYRGKLVSLRGTVKRAYRITAAKNPLGIQEYTVLYIIPQDTVLPVVVFCLETPPGFPRLENNDRGGHITALNEPVSITGYFFKSWVYLADTETVSAPLLLARRPYWKATPSGQASRTPLSTMTLLLIFVGTATLAVGLATMVYLRSRRPRIPIDDSDPSQVVSSLLAIPKDQVLPSTSDSLKSLANSQPASPAGKGEVEQGGQE